MQNKFIPSFKNLQSLYLFQHQLQSLISKASTKYHSYQTWTRLGAHFKFLSNCECVKPNKLCASKIQLWDRHEIHISIPREIGKEGGMMGLKQDQSLGQNPRVLICSRIITFNSGFLGVYAQQWDCWVIR